MADYLQYHHIDSDEYGLECIFSMISAETLQIVYSYNETIQQTNHLFGIPKYSFLMCVEAIKRLKLEMQNILMRLQHHGLMSKINSSSNYNDSIQLGISERFILYLYSIID